MSYTQALRLFVLSALSVRCIAQHGPVIPQGSTVQTAQATCVILKRMGPAGDSRFDALVAYANNRASSPSKK